MSRILAVDPGEVRIGLAMSDPNRTIAYPISAMRHISRSSDAQRIVELAEENEVGLILIGLPLDAQGEISPQARKSLRLLEAIRSITNILIGSWDETGSTETARKLGSHQTSIDSRAAAVFLQEYLDAESQ